jgi:hypothetical protein
MIHLYPHPSELRPVYLYVSNTVHLVQQIEYIDLEMHKMENLKLILYYFKIVKWLIV